MQKTIMKIYSYKCRPCETLFDVYDVKATMTIYCPVCGEEAHRDYKRETNPIHFRGSGFYKTDNKENKSK